MGGVDEGRRHRRLPGVDGFVKCTHRKRTTRKGESGNAVDAFPKRMDGVKRYAE